jgi:hypothetical protein
MNLNWPARLWQGKPAGIVLFVAPENDPQTYPALADMGYDFCSLYGRHAVIGSTAES